MKNNTQRSGNSDPNACIWSPEIPGGRPLAVGQAHYGELALGQGSPERTPPGNSLNPISSSYLPINAGPLPPRSVAGNAIIRAEGNTDALTAPVSAKGHERVSEPLGSQQPHGPGGTGPVSGQVWGCPHQRWRQRLLTEAFLSVARSIARPGVLQPSISMPNVCPRLFHYYFFSL